MAAATVLHVFAKIDHPLGRLNVFLQYKVEASCVGAA